MKNLLKRLKQNEVVNRVSQPKFKVGDKVFLRATITRVITDGKKHEYSLEMAKHFIPSYEKFDEGCLEYAQ